MNYDRSIPSFSVPTLSRVVTTLGAGIDRCYQPTLDTLVGTSLWLSAALASLTLFTAHVLHLAVDLRAAVLVFASSLWIYNRDHLKDAGEGNSAQLRGLHTLMVAGAIGTLVTLAAAPLSAWLVFAGYGGIGLLYAARVVPVFTSRGVEWLRLKDIPATKSWMVAAAIAFATVGLPVAFSGSAISFQALCVWTHFFVFVGTGAHMCDMRDIEADRRENVPTLPVLLGVVGAKRVLGAVHVGFLGLLAAAWAFDGFGAHPEILAVCAVACLFVYWIRPGSPREAWSVGIDGAFFLPAFLASLHSGVMHA